MNKLKPVFFCLLFVWVLFSSTNTVFADELDDLLDKCEIAPNPKPSVMVYDYELSPETLMPGDVGVLTITLKNMQDKPIEKDVDIKSEIKGSSGYVIDIDAETRFTMDAYIKEAYIVEREFKVYNRYSSAGVLGPDSKVDLAFKIKAPLEEGIYMLKFIADIEDMEGKSSKGIRYFIPIVVTGTVNILPLEVFENEVRLEVINEGLSDVNGVYVVAAVSNASGVECQPERVYIGKIKYGESAIAVFKVNKAEEEVNRAVFKAVYKTGINKHESNQICVIIPCLHCEEEKREQEQSETSFSALTVTPTATPTPTPTRSSSSSSTSALKLTDFGAVFTFVGLFVVAVAFAKKKKKKRQGRG